MNKIETHRVGILGHAPLLSNEVGMKAVHKFTSVYGREPSQIRLSPEAFNDLRAMAERTTELILDKYMGMDIKVDYDMKDRVWQVCHEETKVYAI